MEEQTKKLLWKLALAAIAIYLIFTAFAGFEHFGGTMSQEILAPDVQYRRMLVDGESESARKRRRRRILNPTQYYAPAYFFDHRKDILPDQSKCVRPPNLNPDCVNQKLHETGSMEQALDACYKPACASGACWKQMGTGTILDAYGSGSQPYGVAGPADQAVYDPVDVNYSPYYEGAVNLYGAGA